MAAISVCFELFGPGDHIICSEDLYGGVIRLHRTISAKNGLSFDYADTSDIDNIKKLLKPQTKALYIETPSNPMMNVTDLRGFLAEHLPQIKLVEPQGTYFAWLDCSALGFSRNELNDLIVNRAKLWLDAGHIFGGGAEQFQRVVLACPKATLEKALLRLEKAILEK